jgi:hypothetical protein
LLFLENILLSVCSTQCRSGNTKSSAQTVNFWSSKPLDPDWIRIGIQPKILDPDPYQMNTDPQLCFWQPVRKGKTVNHAGFYGLLVLCSVSDSKKHLDFIDFMWPPAVPLLN